MPSRPDDEVSRAGVGRSALLAVGVTLAVIATGAAFLVDDPRVLKAAVVLAAWGGVAATVVAVRRRAEHQAVLAREADLRRGYERELDLEAAARREFELELENDLQHRTEQAVHEELGYLRADIAALDRVREEVARVSALAGDLSSLSGLRAELAALSTTRRIGDDAALDAIRGDLGQLAELRADLGRLRAEIVEQFSGEMLVERIVMRTQAARKPAEAPPPAISPGWADEPLSRELTAGWQSFRLDAPGPTREYEHVRPVSSPAAPPPAASYAVEGTPTAENPFVPVRPVPYRRRHTDESAPWTDRGEAVTTERPLSAPGSSYPRIDHPAAPSAPETDGHARLSEILAESGAPPSGGRRRRRYREEGEPDDVLARVLRDTQ
jgi:hypothetical protein